MIDDDDDFFLFSTLSFFCWVEITKMIKFLSAYLSYSPQDVSYGDKESWPPQFRLWRFSIVFSEAKRSSKILLASLKSLATEINFRFFIFGLVFGRTSTEKHPPDGSSKGREIIKYKIQQQKRWKSVIFAWT